MGDSEEDCEEHSSAIVRHGREHGEQESVRPTVGRRGGRKPLSTMRRKRVFSQAVRENHVKWKNRVRPSETLANDEDVYGGPL